MPTQVKGACRRCWYEAQPTAGMGGALFGSGGLRGDLANGAGWVINLAIAEWVIRRRAPGGAARTVPAVPH